MRRILPILTLALVAPIIPAQAACETLAWTDPLGDAQARTFGLVTGSTTGPVDITAASIVATPGGTDVVFEVIDIVRPTGPIEAYVGYTFEYRSAGHSFRAFAYLLEDRIDAAVYDYGPETRPPWTPGGTVHPATVTVSSNTIVLHVPAGAGMQPGTSITNFELSSEEGHFVDPTGGALWDDGFSSSGSDQLWTDRPESRSFSVPSC